MYLYPYPYWDRFNVKLHQQHFSSSSHVLRISFLPSFYFSTSWKMTLPLPSISSFPAKNKNNPFGIKAKISKTHAVTSVPADVGLCSVLTGLTANMHVEIKSQCELEKNTLKNKLQLLLISGINAKIKCHYPDNTSSYRLHYYAVYIQYISIYIYIFILRTVGSSHPHWPSTRRTD